MEEHFLLETPLARRLYREVAAGLPVIDYHNHLSAADLAADRRFGDVTELWIDGDPYKHRAMRIAGVPERLITGAEASPRERFDAWAATVPQTLGNPLYHWSVLELARVFGIDEPLSSDSADRIWETANAKLREPAFSARGLLTRFNAECVCTSDRLLNDLAAHRALAASDFAVRVLPSLRGDDIAAVSDSGFGAWVRRLGVATGAAVGDYATFQQAVRQRLDAFDTLGCRLADHALDAFAYEPTREDLAAELFARCANGDGLSTRETLRLRSAVLRFLGGEYAARGWTLQLHLGAQRRTSSRLRGLAGAAGGYAAIGHACDVESVCAFLDDLETGGVLPRTLLYTLNPADNEVLASLTGSYAEDGVAGKIQFGPAWWYNDHLSGIRRHLDAVSSYGLLSVFVGMTTDSRSLLSMVRHEFFRRALCGWLGEQAAAGWMPDDFKTLAPLARAVAYGNAKELVLGTETKTRY